MVDEPNIAIASRPGRGVLAAAILGSSVALLDGTVVNIALPHIGRDLHSKIDGLQWVINGYTLMLASLVLAGGALGDRFGRKRIFIIGLSWFGIASVLCGLAPTMTTLIIARILQGIGAGLLTPGSLAIIQSTIRSGDRARAIGAWSGLGGVAAAAGPFLGGWLVDALDWRWVFFINVPIIAASLFAALHWVPETRGSSITGRFDVLGSALGALFLGGITYALVESSHSIVAIISGSIGVVAGVAFLIVERHRTNPILPPSMFANRQFSAINTVTFFVYAALGGVLFFLVLELQVVSGYSALAAGITMLPFTLLMLVFSARAGAFGERIGPYVPLTFGPALAALGVLLLLNVGHYAPYWSHVFPGVMIMSIGMTLTVAPLTASVLAAAEQGRAGIASGINNAVARAASLIAVAGLPLIAGLSGRAFDDPSVLDPAYRIGVLACAGLFTAAAVLAAMLVRNPAKQRDVTDVAVHPACRTQCAYGAPQLDPGTEVDAPPDVHPGQTSTTR